MRENEWHKHPFISAWVVSGSVVLMMLSAYYFFDTVPDTPVQILKLQLQFALGIVLWIAGCGMVSRTRFSTWTHGLLLGLLFIPGLLLLIRRTGGKNRQEVWQEANPGLVGSQLRRQYRDVKALY